MRIVHEICGFRINSFCFNGYLHCYLAFNVGNDFLVFVIAEIVLFVRLGLNAYYCSDYFFHDGVLYALTCLYGLSEACVEISYLNQLLYGFNVHTAVLSAVRI